MKAHLAREPRALLLWNVPLSPAVELVAGNFRCKARVLTAADLDTAVGALCEGRAAAAVPSAPDAAPVAAAPDTPALIVSGLRHDNGELSTVLDSLKRLGVTPPLRAMVTPTSKGWTLRALLAELNAEHAAVTGQTPAEGAAR